MTLQAGTQTKIRGVFYYICSKTNHSKPEPFCPKNNVSEFSMISDVERSCWESVCSWLQLVAGGHVMASGPEREMNRLNNFPVRSFAVYKMDS